MGTWGTGISSNDTYADVYDEFIDLYNEGFSVDDITKKLISKNQKTIDTPQDSANFWFALANAQWECKELDPEIFSKVEQIVLSGEEIKNWEALGATPVDIKARGKALAKFLAKIQTNRERVRKRTKKKLYDSLFEKGDCLTYTMNNGNYGGALVLSDEKSSIAGINMIAFTTIDQPDKPTLADFVNCDIYVQRQKQTIIKNNKLVEVWIDQPQIGDMFTPLYKQTNVKIEVVGKLLIYKEYINPANRRVGFGWIQLEIKVPFRKEYELINGVPNKVLKLTNLIGSDNLFTKISMLIKSLIKSIWSILI
jgi:hypothetical protein